MLCVGYRIYKWIVFFVQTRINNLLRNVRDINNNVYFNTLKLGLIFSDFFTAEHNVYCNKM